MYKPTNDNVYGAIERRLRDENFNVLHLYRDHRGDWGDDGGYIVSISEKKDDPIKRVYLHILEVNYNCEVDVHILTADDPRIHDADAYMDFIVCSNINCAQTVLDNIVNRLDYIIDNNIDNLSNEDPFIKQFLNTMMYPYSEYKEDKEVLLKLTSIPYTPNYDDPDEYIDSDDG